jgi:hypothetical protein
VGVPSDFSLQSELPAFLSEAEVSLIPQEARKQYIIRDVTTCDDDETQYLVSLRDEA